MTQQTLTVTDAQPAGKAKKKQDQAKPDDKMQLPQVLVESRNVIPIGEQPDAEGIHNYVVTRTTTGSKAKLPNSFVPQTVATVSRKLMDDQAVRTINEALTNVAGVNNATPGYFPLDQYYVATIRGFPNSMVLRDGLWDPAPFGNQAVVSVDRVEVLKGPSALMYGAFIGGIGGVINVISKKPLPYFAGQIGTEIDNFGSHVLKGDVSTPLTADGNWLARTSFLIGGYDAFYQTSQYTKAAVSEIIQGRLSAQDAITAGYEYRWQRSKPYSGIPYQAAMGKSPNQYLSSLGWFGRDLNVNDPRGFWTFVSQNVRFAYEHEFNQDWSFKSSSQYTKTARDQTAITATAGFSPVGSPLYTQNFQQIKMGPVYSIDTDQTLTGHFDTLGIKHDLVAGARFADSWYKMDMRRPTPNPFGTGANAITFTNPYDPNWGVPFGNLQQYMYGFSAQSQFNEYINDIISFTDRLRLSTGLNYVQYNSYSRSGMNPNPAMQGSTLYHKNGIGWRVGLMYDILPELTGYASYATTFQPQPSNVTTDGHIQNFDPLYGDQKEVGLKYNVTDFATAGVALYDIILSNVTAADPDPLNAQNGYKVQTGKQRSTGGEVETTLHPLPGWDMLASYSHINARIVQDGTYQIGSPVPNVPKDYFRFWTTYEFQDGPAQGFTIGGGLTTSAGRTTNLISQASPNLVAYLGGYTTFDLMAAYRFGPAKVSVNIKNLFNTRYWAGTASSYNYLYPGQPLTVIARLSVDF
ncbi:TonB-dependent siderophore receptor [Beijerinckia indica]|nr:TonB-dependent siderophore receptor [Beijerinckia indica]